MDEGERNSTVSNATKTKVWESAVPPAMQFGLGVIGNLIALVVLVKSAKSHKWRPFYRLVGGLALTDGGGILLVYPTVMVRYATDFTYDFPVHLCNYSSFIYTFTLISSAMIVCAMSVDRFMAILYPFIYNTEGKERRTNIMLISIWITGTFISCLQLMGLGSSFNYYPGSWCFLNFVGTTTLDRANSYIYSLFGLAILALTISLNFIVIVSVCRGMKSNIKVTAKRRRKNDIFIVIFLLIIVTVFGVCWTPLMFTILGHAGRWIEGNGARELLVLRFAVNNSIIDPWIYILLRKETLRALQRHCRGYCDKLDLATETSGPESNPAPSYSQSKSLDKTISTDDHVTISAGEKVRM
ncbi:prostaglandin E2 receptor EP4 subtype-like [Saccostrea cucullata]|uniref:prostaglandin E2 receptor EP4 subtype-like n=1 Tax=Saccostrea cuccullata TaxID=36930 RepID=UPI002ED5ACD1